MAEEVVGRGILDELRELGIEPASSTADAVQMALDEALKEGQPRAGEGGDERYRRLVELRSRVHRPEASKGELVAITRTDLERMIGATALAHTQRRTPDEVVAAGRTAATERVRGRYYRTVAIPSAAFAGLATLLWANRDIVPDAGEGVLNQTFTIAYLVLIGVLVTAAGARWLQEQKVEHAVQSILSVSGIRWAVQEIAEGAQTDDETFSAWEVQELITYGLPRAVVDGLGESLRESIESVIAEGVARGWLVEDLSDAFYPTYELAPKKDGE